MDIIYVGLIEFVKLLAAASLGGAMTHFYAVRRQRTDMTLALIKEYLQMVPAVGRSLGYLREGEALAREMEWQRDVIAVGNWFDTFAYLYRERRLVSHVMEALGIEQEALRFRSAVISPAKSVPEIGRALEAWANLGRL